MPPPYTIVFDAYHLYHLPQFEPLIRLLQTDDRFRVILTSAANNPTAEQQLAARVLETFHAETVLAKTEKERAARLKALAPDIFVCGWSRYPLPEFMSNSTLAVMLYHGIGVKPSYWLDNHDRLDIRFIEGPERAEQLRRHGVTTELAEVGFPKLDPLIMDQANGRPDLTAQLGLDPAKPTVLFAPTFYPNSLEPLGEHLGSLTEDFNLILKLHQWAYFENQFRDLRLGRQVTLAEKLAANYGHIHLLGPEQYNIIPYLLVADVLLTEASSTIYEMLAIGKPVVVNRFYRLRWSHRLTRSRLFKKRLDAEMSRNLSAICYELHRPDDLGSVLHKALQRNNPFREAQQKAVADLLGNLDGHASARVRDTLLEHLERRPT